MLELLNLMPGYGGDCMIEVPRVLTGAPDFFYGLVAVLIVLNLVAGVHGLGRLCRVIETHLALRSFPRL